MEFSSPLFTGEHLCLKSRVNWLPKSVLSDEGICQDEKLAHDGSERLFGLFSGSQQAVVEGFESAVVADRGEGGHVEGQAGKCSTASDVPSARLLAAIIGERGKAGQVGNGFFGDLPDLVQLDHERGGGDRTDAGNGQQDFVLSKERCLVLDAFDDLGIEAFDARRQGFDLALQFGLEKARLCLGVAIAKRCQVRRCGMASPHDLLQLFEGFIAGRYGFEFEALAHHGEQLGINPVSLGEGAECFGKVPRAQRIDDRHRVPSGMKGALRVTMQLPCRFHHDETDAVRDELFPQLPETNKIVGNAQRVAKWVHIDVEPGFTNINADINSRLSAWFGHILALHAGLAPFHLLKTSAKDERTKLPHGSCQGGYGPARPIPEGMAIPSGINPNLLVIRAARQTSKLSGVALARSRTEEAQAPPAPRILPRHRRAGDVPTLLRTHSPNRVYSGRYRTKARYRDSSPISF